jgi:hypothetical protein
MLQGLWDRIEPADAEIIKRHLAEYPVKVGELANALGIEVVRSPLAPRVSGLIEPSETSRSGFRIRVNKYEVPERQRFTVAHEIAHYLLHRDHIGCGVIDNVLYRSNLTSRKERDANRLAAEIVMPSNWVMKELERRGGREVPGVAEELAALFKVSPPAMRVRLGIN